MKEKYIFKVVQKAIIRLDDTYLILKRSPDSKSYPGYWDLAGGKLEHGEKFEKALIREVKEETNLDIVVEESIFIYVESKVENSYAVLFNCEKRDGDIKLSDEHTEYKWVTKSEAQKLKLEPFLKDFFEKID
ncbi:MAG: NUDIX domain-containing protein [archaeon]|jgi:8-oxo-dGTP diphosphatase